MSIANLGSIAGTEYLSVAQAAKRLGITRQAVLKRINSGRLAATRIGRAYAVPAYAIDSGWGRDDAVLAEVVRRLVEAYEPERVYLFGASARGDTGPDSDYDVLLVMPDDAPAERLRAGLASKVLWDVGAPVDVVLWRRGRFDARAAAVRTSLPATVLREGVLLHAA